MTPSRPSARPTEPLGALEQQGTNYWFNGRWGVDYLGSWGCTRHGRQPRQLRSCARRVADCGAVVGTGMPEEPPELPLIGNDETAK